MYTNDGLILHLAQDGFSWTDDLGENWRTLPHIPETRYYPRAVQLEDGSIICLAHMGGDDVYGFTDQAIVQQTLRLSVTRERESRSA